MHLDEAETLSLENKGNNIQYVSYTSELQMPDIMHSMQKDLSEPYSIYTYRYFIHNWPKLCFLVRMLVKMLIRSNDAGIDTYFPILYI